MTKEKRRSSAIITKKNKILLIHRKKEGREYYVFPGGGIKNGETPESAVIREVQEETNLAIEHKELVYEWFEEEKNIKHPFFICTLLGNVKPKLGGPEKNRHSAQNWYRPEWININTINQLVIYPQEVKLFLLNNIHQK